MAIFLPFFLIPVHAFEGLKHEASSGWNKFERTLPITRRRIVASKYIAFLLLLFLSVCIVALPFVMAHIFLFPTMNGLFYNYLLRAIGLIVCVASLNYPLTYKLGIEKADTITLMSGGFSLSMFFLTSVLLLMVIGEIPHFDEVFSTTFFILGIVCFTISYVMSNIFYKRR